jgi:nicotinate-nucleotide pyrophosphorylase (carboxylating)
MQTGGTSGQQNDTYPTSLCPDFEVAGFDVATFIRATLAEDLGEGLPGGGRDVTAESVIPAEARFAG